MSDPLQPYTPTVLPSDVMMLTGNHFKFVITDLPDLTFFAQTIILPDISVPVVERKGPFSTIREVGDHLEFGMLSVSYSVDAAFKSYYSLYHWIRGYGFPESYDDRTAFRRERVKVLANPNPTPREIEKTNAALYILRPDTDEVVAQIRFKDLFPTSLGQLTFDTTVGEPTTLKTQATFAYTTFDVELV